jgi:predicted acylesterase/phospholipase RssA
MVSNKDVTNVQRALVLQGGGALGAYEAGVVKGLCDRLQKEDQKNGEIDKSLFDIVAGTSIGAINGAVLVSQFLKNKKKGLDVFTSWKNSIEQLEVFWKHGALC